jgi:hypothetical protein
MNCANHPDRERAAFCQNCGKPLCTECIRNVGTSVFCEPCLTARVAAAPPAGYAPGPATYPTMPPPVIPGEPNPGIAALLGFIPGVGAMYNGQYAKGIVHLMVFALLVSLANDVNGIFGLFIAGWEAYMVIEAHHTARARRDGTPLPNPFGLNDLSERLGFGKAWPGAGPAVDPTAGPSAYPPPDPNVPPAGAYAPPYGHTHVPPVSSWVAPNDPAAYAVPPVPPVPPYLDPDLPYYRRFPSGAIWLIVLGLFFMLGDTPFFRFFHGRFLGPILLIGLGVWVFVRKMTNSGQGIENDGTPLYHWRLMRAITSCFWLVLTGVIWLLDEVHILSWSRSWPLYVIGAGLMMFFRHTAHSDYGYGYTPPVPPVPPAAPVTSSTAIVPSAGQPPTGRNDQEGR